MESLLLIIEFFYIKGIKGTIWYILIPVILGLLLFYKSDSAIYSKNAATFHTDLVTVLGILIGFSISTFTVLLTVTGSSVDAAKAKSIDKKLFSKEFSLFDSVLIGMAYSILIQGFLLIADFIWPTFIEIEGTLGKILFSINISLMAHIILILMRNVLDFYFMITKRD